MYVNEYLYIESFNWHPIHNKQTHYTDNVVAVVAVVAVHCRIKKRENKCEMLKAQYFVLVIFWVWEHGIPNDGCFFVCAKLSVCVYMRAFKC